MPRLHLGLMARRAGDTDAAHRELGQALVLLKREDASRLLLFGGGFGRDALIALCRAELQSAGAVMSTNEWRTGADRIFAVAAALRRSFDDSFAAPAASMTESLGKACSPFVSVAIRTCCACPTSWACTRIVRIIAVPSRMPQFWGSWGFVA